MRPLLQTRDLKAGYLGREVVRAVDLEVHAGEVVCLLGPNGAGKTTTLLTIAGELTPVDGLVLFDNVPTFTPMDQRVRDGGIGLVTEERLVFTKMTARDNLRLGGGSVEDALALFPELEPRLSVRGGMLSGGEQQMLQERCQYEPGDVVVAWTESQPAFSKKVQYRIIDAALGTVEKGWYHNDDAANEQPWLPNGPIPHTVTWTLPGYEAPGVPHPGTGGR